MEDLLDPENDTHYTVPSWFLENHVETDAETARDEPNFAVVDEALYQPDGEGLLSRFEILQEDYDVIRLTAAAALVRDHAGALPEKMPSITLDMGGNDYPVSGDGSYFSYLVKRLAHDLGACLISVALDDLEDICREFYLQDQQKFESVAREPTKPDEVFANNVTGNTKVERSTPEHFSSPDLHSPYGFVLFYFGISHKGEEYEKIARRSRAAMSALIDSVLIKQAKERTKCYKSPATVEPPVLLHIKDTKSLNKEETKQLLLRFASYIEELRTAVAGVNRKVLGIASNSRCNEFLDGVRWKMLGIAPNGGCDGFPADKCMAFDLPPPPNYSTHTAFYQRGRKNHAQAVNTRQFKKILQGRLGNVFESGVLDLNDSEDMQQRWKTDVFSGNKICDKDDLESAAIQVAGMQWDKDGLTFDDVSTIAARMRRKRRWDDEEPPKTDSGTEKNCWEGLTLKQRQEKISGPCSMHEKSLLYSIVDPEELTTTYNDVIISQEVKEQVKQLIYMSQLRPQSLSKSLLQQIRISGALFYGPPGTGKTLLCKAIASDSCYNMLSLNPANIHNSLIGETEKNISAAFSLAAKLSPCILFIDEADALLYRRADSDKSWERSVLNQFLEELDGLATRFRENAPFVIVCTNRPNDLDTAFIRRLPHKVLFTLPTAAERAQILRIFLHTNDIDPELDLEALANRMKGFSGSDIHSLCGHAALAWAIEQNKSQPNKDKDITAVQVCLKQRHFEAALKKTKPTVSEKSTKDLREFAQRFNPEEYSAHEAVCWESKRQNVSLDASRDLSRTKTYGRFYRPTG